MTTDPDTMTLDQCRDELARLMGWSLQQVDGYTIEQWRWTKDDVRDPWHPVGTTLEAIAAAMPEGWGWATIRVQPESVQAEAGHRNGRVVNTTADTEPLARARLAVKCRRAADAK